MLGPMRSSVFFSYPKPWNPDQETFVEHVSEYLQRRGLEPRTLGVTDYDMDAPLVGVRRLMMECNGVVTIAFRRVQVREGVAKRRRPSGELGDDNLRDQWLTTPWAHIEAAMAFQLGLPVLIFREAGVIADGLLEPGVVGLYMPDFDAGASVREYLESPQWTEPLGQWEGRVRAVVERKGRPPVLY
jgi:hypothetical protein